MPKRRSRKNSSYKLHSGFVTLLLVLLVVALGLVFSGALMGENTLKSKKGTIPAQVISTTPGQGSNNLQLQTLAFGEVKPCEYDSEKGENCVCPATQYYPPYRTDKPEQECRFVAPDKVNDECTLLKLCEQNTGGCNWNSSAGCPIPRSLTGNIIEPEYQNIPNPPGLNCAAWKRDLLNGKIWCVGKPVIYLYPEKPTLVDVKLSIPGDIYISIPKYPGSGWKNVFAAPDGTLSYQGKQYKQLYYESAVKIEKVPSNGIIIPTSNLENELSSIVTKLGLKPSERDEFLDYWMPKLTELNKTYIVFSLLEQDEKERIDGVSILPKPDVFINFIAYFKGIDKPFDITPLALPVPPARTGFTAVEWGGTIDPSGQ